MKSCFCKPNSTKQNNFTGQLFFRNLFVLQEIGFAHLALDRQRWKLKDNAMLHLRKEILHIS